MAKKTALYDKHVKLSANIVDFAGWDMPVRYSSIKDEVMAVRKQAGMFDVSHMGEFFLDGPDAHKVIDYIMTNDYLASPIGKAVYSPLCDNEGGIIDDAIGYKLSSERSLLCVNASNIEKDKAWVLKAISDKKFQCEFTDASEEMSLIALQGPDSEKVLNLIWSTQLAELEYYGVKEQDNFLLARTGYTGEDGFEIFGPHNEIKLLWEQLIATGVTPCGLAARDVLRLEVAYPLYGQDLNEKLTPLDCSLGWTVKLAKADFLGKTALHNHKPSKRLIKLELESGIPRPGQAVYQDDKRIGEVTSGTMSVTLGKGICLASVDKEVFNKDELHFLEIRGKKYQANFKAKPFVAGGHK